LWLALDCRRKCKLLNLERSSSRALSKGIENYIWLIGGITTSSQCSLSFEGFHARILESGQANCSCHEAVPLLTGLGSFGNAGVTLRVTARTSLLESGNQYTKYSSRNSTRIRCFPSTGTCPSILVSDKSVIRRGSCCCAIKLK